MNKKYIKIAVTVFTLSTIFSTVLFFQNCSKNAEQSPTTNTDAHAIVTSENPQSDYVSYKVSDKFSNFFHYQFTQNKYDFEENFIDISPNGDKIVLKSTMVGYSPIVEVSPKDNFSVRNINIPTLDLKNTTILKYCADGSKIILLYRTGALTQDPFDHIWKAQYALYVLDASNFSIVLKIENVRMIEHISNFKNMLIFKQVGNKYYALNLDNLQTELIPKISEITSDYEYRPFFDNAIFGHESNEILFILSQNLYKYNWATNNKTVLLNFFDSYSKIVDFKLADEIYLNSPVRFQNLFYYDASIYDNQTYIYSVSLTSKNISNYPPPINSFVRGSQNVLVSKTQNGVLYHDKLSGDLIELDSINSEKTLFNAKASRVVASKNRETIILYDLTNSDVTGNRFEVKEITIFLKK